MSNSYLYRPFPIILFSRVLKEINRGGTAVVYSGIDLAQQKKVALKVMSAKHKKEGNLRAGRCRLSREHARWQRP